MRNGFTYARVENSGDKRILTLILTNVGRNLDGSAHEESCRLLWEMSRSILQQTSYFQKSKSEVEDATGWFILIATINSSKLRSKE